MVTVPEYTHKINERLVLIRGTDKTFLRVRIRRISDGYYFVPSSNNFFSDDGSIDPDTLWYYFEDLYTIPGLKSRTIVTLPTIVQDLIFEYQAFNFTLVNNPDYVSEEVTPGEDEFIEGTEIDLNTLETFYERHLFGGAQSISEPTLCKVFGTLKDVSGKPLAGQKIEAYLNRAGFFTHKAGLIGYAATTLTDETGYFQLPLVVGLDVTINVPIVGFTTRGFVPNLTEVELTTQSLLSYQAG